MRAEMEEWKQKGLKSSLFLGSKGEEMLCAGAVTRTDPQTSLSHKKLSR